MAAFVAVFKYMTQGRPVSESTGGGGGRISYIIYTDNVDPSGAPRAPLNPPDAVVQSNDRLQAPKMRTARSGWYGRLQTKDLR